MSKKAYIVIAGLALAAAAALRPQKTRALNPLERTPNPEKPIPGHVGQEDFEWPLQDRFGVPVDFQRALQNLGYDVDLDGDVLGETTRGAVSAFQLDWSMVTRQSDNAFGPVLEDNGYIDMPTVPALAGALHLQRSQGTDWFNIVTAALQMSKPEVG